MPLSNSGICGQCQMSPLTHGLCIAPLLHQHEGRFLVHQLKFQNSFRAGRTLAAAMLQSVHRAYTPDDLPECLVPVPLSYRRQVTRGYNQAAWLTHCINLLLARASGLVLRKGLPVFYGPIKRRHGPHQQTLPKRARLALAQNTFSLQQVLPYHHVAIVDDVLTTGTTIRTLRALLQARGATRIDVWCATRATLN